jgi:glycerol-3-phosphate dehydrogenase
MKRQQLFEKLQNEQKFDVAILGGGINGACLYDTLCRQDFKVLLVDKGDFASGTSQSSGMMIWGGLLYLRNLDLSCVFKLSSDRDEIIRKKGSWMAPEMMRFLPSVESGRVKWLIKSGLWLYWLMGLCRRCPPRSENSFSELALLKSELGNYSLVYEEAFLDQSDARLVYRWIAPHRASGQIALNHCTPSGTFSAIDKCWHLDVVDEMTTCQYQVQSKMIVNCAGVWTDQVNAEYGINSPFRHALSKGVYLGIPRHERHQSSLFFDLGEHDDVITYVPWGPISLWGPTETAVQSISEGLTPTKQDVDYLLEQYRRRFRDPISRKDVISVRCGIRPLVVDSQYRGDKYPLELSRRQEIIQDREKPWISCYGGKITGCTRMASKTLALIKKTVAPTAENCTADETWESDLEQMEFPGLLQPVPSAAWCAKHELCCTLEDYLRRRTNISQWIPRGGLGENDSNAHVLKDIALDLAHGNGVLASGLYETYRKKILSDFDPLFVDK